MSTPRKRRTLKERIADQERELQELKEKAALAEIENAFDEGRVTEENHAAFKALRKDIGVMKKAIKVANNHGNEGLVRILDEFRTKLATAMSELIQPKGD
jgi:hypothetical protein